LISLELFPDLTRIDASSFVVRYPMQESGSFEVVQSGNDRAPISITTSYPKKYSQVYGNAESAIKGDVI
jgi:hypothetical protein